MKQNTEKSLASVKPGKHEVVHPSETLPAFASGGISADARLREASMSPRPAIFFGFAVLAAFVLGTLLWFIYVPLRSAVHAPAEIVFKSKRQSVQHLEGGIVKKILVKDGDMVKAGQPLIELENSQVEPLVNMLEEQNLAEIAYTARVEAESKDLPSISFPRSLTSRAREPSVAKVMRSEGELFRARKVAFEHQVQAFRLQIAEFKESIKGTEERLTTKRQEIATIKEQLDANLALRKQGYVTNTVVLDLQRSLASLTGDKVTLSASIAADRQRIAELEQRILSIKAERVQGAISEMKQSTMRRIDEQERVRPLRDTLERQVIRAPVTGKVVGLKVTTVGGVVQPRDQLMEIAPTGDHLVLQAKIRLEDISEISAGQLADVRISGLDPRQTPNIMAKLTYISDDRIVPPPNEGMQPYYAALLEFEPASLTILDKVGLKSGMTAQIAIGTKPHSPFDYIMTPLRDHVRKALDTR